MLVIMHNFIWDKTSLNKFIYLENTSEVEKEELRFIVFTH